MKRTAQYSRGMFSKGLFDPALGLAQVLLIDGRGNELVRSLKVDGYPTELGQIGKCIVVLSKPSKTIHFLDATKAGDSPVVATWNLTDSPLHVQLEAPAKMSIDAATGQVYVRSLDDCASCSPTRNSVVVAEDTSGATLKACKLR